MKLPTEVFLAVEADIFWCLSKLVEDVQDNFMDEQPGVHKMLKKMEAVVKQQDSQILTHLDELEINFVDFAYRWVHCYLTREFNIY